MNAVRSILVLSAIAIGAVIAAGSRIHAWPGERDVAAPLPAARASGVALNWIAPVGVMIWMMSRGSRDRERAAAVEQLASASR